MFAPQIVPAAVISGPLTGTVYALVSVVLTLVYGVLHSSGFAPTGSRSPWSSRT